MFRGAFKRSFAKQHDNYGHCKALEKENGHDDGNCVSALIDNIYWITEGRDQIQNADVTVKCRPFR